MLIHLTAQEVNNTRENFHRIFRETSRKVLTKNSFGWCDISRKFNCYKGCRCLHEIGRRKFLKKSHWKESQRGGSSPKFHRIFPEISQIIASKKSCEVDPTKIDRPENMEENQKNLIETVKSVSELIFSSAEATPMWEISMNVLEPQKFPENFWHCTANYVSFSPSYKRMLSLNLELIIPLVTQLFQVYFSL